jgi:DNA-binding HxlR family transcriptional regulator
MTDQRKKKYHNLEECPIIHALEILGGKWRFPILSIINSTGSIRYNELKRRIPGITNIMLTRSLQALVEHGLVKRQEFNQIPPHVEYTLTDVCKDLEPAYEILDELGKKLSEQPPTKK